ncbi:MAG: hypothetical protein HY289_08220 [Planctomycetes bacterium]|nr:hypothetical protein [Planctomycetota bacterium]
MEKPITYRRLRKILKTFGIHEEKSRGKGSERMFVGVVDGVITRYPTKCHNEGDMKPNGVIRAFRRRVRNHGRRFLQPGLIKKIHRFSCCFPPAYCPQYLLTSSRGSRRFPARRGLTVKNLLAPSFRKH